MKYKKTALQGIEISSIVMTGWVDANVTRLTLVPEWKNFRAWILQNEEGGDRTLVEDYGAYYKTVNMSQKEVEDIMEEHSHNLTGEDQLVEVKRYKYAIEYLKDPSEEVKLAAVEQEGDLIVHIENPSEKVQLIAVKQRGYVIRHIKNPSVKVQLTAVKRHGCAITHIKNPSREVQLASLEQDPRAIGYIENPSEEMQLIAVRMNGDTLYLISNPSATVIHASGKEYI